MTKKNKIILGAVGAISFTALAAGGALVSAQAATNQTPMIDRVAQIIGVDSTKLKDGFKQASKEEVDQRVKDGKLTQTEADRIKERIDQGDFHLGGMRGDMLGGKGAAHVAMGEIATYLGISNDDLMKALKDGKTLTALAVEKGKSEADLKQFLSQKFDEKLQTAVKDGKITQAQADVLAKNKDEMITKLMSGKGPGGFRPMGRGMRGEQDQKAGS